MNIYLNDYDMTFREKVFIEKVCNEDSLEHVAGKNDWISSRLSLEILGNQKILNICWVMER